MKIVNLILKFLLFILKEVISFFIKSFLFLIVVLSIAGIFVSQKEKNDIKIPETAYVEIDLARRVSEKKNSITTLLNEREINFYSLLKAINAIEKDSSVRGIMVKLDGMSLNYSQVEELRRKFESLKHANKEVICYASTLSNRSYYLASKASNFIMPPSSSSNINITGYYSELGYYKNFINKLGIEFNVIHVGDYKSYGENYTKDSMSPEYRENITTLYNNIFNKFIEDISQDKKLNKTLLEAEILSGKLMASEPKTLKALNMINTLEYYDTFKEKLGKSKIISINRYALIKNLNIKSVSPNKIALISAEGEIVNARIRGTSNTGIFPEGIINDIDKALNDNSVKGIVIRINSPGGSALASDIIANKITEARKIKPIYISIGGMAASGGYYIASQGNKIYAESNSITGSIGVVSMIPNIKKLMEEKAEIKIETVKKGEYADLYSLSTEFTEEKSKKIYESCKSIYEEFLGVVAKGRNMKKEDVHKIAQGKVWLGTDGIRNGLVDKIGGLEACIADMARDQNLTSYIVEEIDSTMKWDTFLEEYMPLGKVISQINSFYLDKNSYFTPVLLFPYEIDLEVN
ncbi:signal peptide peptidase SppA [Fusobacterium sp. PH5-44]|uniref:signal peptide peptidase SppA n=1 Tax=unclassified Fusobacterium TaxID=2648384 RepID=UPI003D1CE8AF